MTTTEPTATPASPRPRPSALTLGVLALGVVVAARARAARRARLATVPTAALPTAADTTAAVAPVGAPPAGVPPASEEPRASGITEPRASGITVDAVRAVTDLLPPALRHGALVAERHLQEGRFQRSLALVAGLSSVLAGAEVAYEHYRGSYGQRVMWTPVVMSVALAGAGIAGAASPTAARRLLRPVSALTLLDAVVGFGFHVRGIARKPGGWRLPVTNVVMGPPIFAPLLFGVSAYLGVVASYLRPESSGADDRATAAANHDAPRPSPHPAPGRPSIPAEIASGRFQKHLASATVASAFFSGVEALYSHYKNGFRYRVAQSSPLVVAPLLMGAAAASIGSHRAARTILPAASLLAIADGGVGFLYHARGVLRMPGGARKPLYNVIYGPPIFAPLLFAASGALGLLASLMRREPAGGTGAAA